MLSTMKKISFRRTKSECTERTCTSSKQDSIELTEKQIQEILQEEGLMVKPNRKTVQKSRQTAALRLDEMEERFQQILMEKEDALSSNEKGGNTKKLSRKKTLGNPPTFSMRIC